MSTSQPKVKSITVTKLNKYIKNIFDDDYVLRDVFVVGEISNLKKHVTGHYYFTLKDDKSQINAVMFKSYTGSIKCDLKNGMKVCCVGYVSIYEAYGNYQLYTEMIFEEGIGNLSIQFEELKNRLNEKGYFDENHKKAIPQFVKTVAVLTAKDGAAVKDIIRTIKRRNRLIKIIVLPTIVQGIYSKQSIIDNITTANEYNKNCDDKIDVIILGRGGGSIEDLWSFNEEDVVKAIYNSNIPIISSVGHEVDFTLADFVSDLRASTPTSAGEIVSTPLEYMVSDVMSIKDDLDKSIYEKLKYNKRRLEDINSRNALRRPEKIIYNEQLKLQNINKQLASLIDFKFLTTKAKFDECITKLDLLSPIKIMKNGYTLVYKNDDLIKNSKQLKNNDEIKIKFSDGSVNAIVKGED